MNWLKPIWWRNSMICYAIKRDDGKYMNVFGSHFETSIKIWKTKKGAENWFGTHRFAYKNTCKVVKVEIREVE